jgi:hypothetical protein
VNLEARRGGHEGECEPPLVWLVAHLDSKSQPISLLQRSAATVTLLAAWVALVVWICLAVLGVSARMTGVVLSILAAVAALPLILSRPGSKSAGTLDNASGVASIVLAARRMDPASPVGVVLTSAEEFGLAGARAWVEGRRRGIAINCDGVDDSGRVTITAGRGGRELLCRHRIHGFLGPEVRIRRSLPGILLDSTAFSDCGWRACTLSRGTLASLARVHTQRDTLDSLTGTGVEGAANLIVGLAGAIIAEEARTEK